MRPVVSFALCLIMVTIPLAGCIAEEKAPDPTPTAETTLKPPTAAVITRNGTVVDTAALDSPLTVGTGRYSGFSTFEPTIGVTSTGGIFVTSWGGLGRGTHIIRSTDEGANWTDVGPYLIPVDINGLNEAGAVPNSNDPFLYVDPWTDRIIKFDMHVLAAQTFEYSDDDGESWSVATPAYGFPPAVQDHQSLASAPPTDIQPVGYDTVLVYCVNRAFPTLGVWCSSSFDGGLEWTPLVPGYPLGTPQCSGLHGHPVGDNAGRFYRGNPACGGIGVYRSDDSGLTWTEHIVDSEQGTIDGVSGHEIAVAVDAADNVYAFWLGEDGLPYVSGSETNGETWTPAMMVAPPGVTATGFPTVAGGSAGKVSFAYIGSTLEGGYEADQANATWNGYIGTVHDFFAGGDRTVVTVTANDPADPLYRGPCGDRRCGGFGDFIDMAIDPEGRPWVAFADSCYAECLNGTENEQVDQMFIGTLDTGLSLRSDTWLAPLPAPSVKIEDLY